MSNNNFLLSYASDPKKTKGRYKKEEEDEYRNCFERDRGRIIHSNAFRKLEYKTQVFMNYTHDYYRTRLTHTLEVAQIARSIARRLHVNEDITECIALAHDLGHAPFGHTGEDALNISIKKLNLEVDGIEFDHNVQSIRILTYLEQKHADFYGMNLSWEIIEGIAKHNGPLLGKYSLFPTHNRLLLEYNERYNLKLEEFSSAESQIAAISDDIAYSVHDIDDALRANLIKTEDLLAIPLIREIFIKIKDRYSNISLSQIIHKALSNIISTLTNDVVFQSIKNIKDYNIQDVEDIRKLSQPVITFSEEIRKAIVEIKKFNMEKIYKHYKLNRTMNKARRMIEELFKCFYENHNLLPTEWKETITRSPNIVERLTVICDYISGMTDRFAIHEHRRIFDTSYEMTSF
ncbi:deoxyguanosinetriphosphate triphosphohydrolase [Wolbachia endosymbiont of Pentidionis agamae]|uniref:deoxyguanosinetriphosphate triphosphohydrolase n=1 Tax=Wolbachia endosymbiont of Pentidionis agamae TaxID=3110435 RepID=UPI002FD611B3